MGERFLFRFPVLAGVVAGRDDRGGLGILAERVHSGFDGVETVSVIAVGSDSHTTLVHTNPDNRMSALTGRG